MFRIKASYADQLELSTTLEKAREFFGEIRNFTDLMPGIEGIRKEAGGIMRWMVRAEVPIIGAVRASFTVEKTEDSPERLEWSPARSPFFRDSAWSNDRDSCFWMASVYWLPPKVMSRQNSEVLPERTLTLVTEAPTLTSASTFASSMS